MLAGLKTFLLKAVDLSALTFLEPVVRLAWGEEPPVQMRRIGRNIVIPVIAVCLFLVAWTLISDKIQTKAGKLPGPVATYTQASKIWLTHQQEEEKKAAYDLTGPDRAARLAQVDARLDELVALDATARQGVTEAEAAAAAVLAEAQAPLDTEMDALKAQIKTAKATRKTDLKAAATDLDAGNKDAYTTFLAAMQQGAEAIEADEQRLDNLKAQYKAITDAPYDPLVAAQQQATRVAEEKQHLMAMKDLLGSRNRGEKLAGLETKLETATAAFYAAPGEKAYNAANKISMTERSVTRTTEADYPTPYTLPYPVLRSIMCVFVGFLIGTAVAVPVGVLCGLSPTIMAAMTPFIALFKPVSPIVWLPIMLIIVTGLVGDPDNNAFIQFLWKLPLVGSYEINPAFLASAAVVALCSLWATLANTALGVASIDQDHINVARVLKLGFWNRLFKIVLPSALPLMFAGMRISLGVGWMVLVAAELLASSEGIGKYVIDQFNNGSAESFASLIVVVFVVGAIGLLLDRIMIVFQRLVSFDGSVASI